MVQGIDVAAVHVAEDLYGICSTLIIGQLPIGDKNNRQRADPAQNANLHRDRNRHTQRSRAASLTCIKKLLHFQNVRVALIRYCVQT